MLLIYWHGYLLQWTRLGFRSKIILALFYGPSILSTSPSTCLSCCSSRAYFGLRTFTSFLVLPFKLMCIPFNHSTSELNNSLCTFSCSSVRIIRKGREYSDEPYIYDADFSLMLRTEKQMFDEGLSVVPILFASKEIGNMLLRLRILCCCTNWLIFVTFLLVI